MTGKLKIAFVTGGMPPGGSTIFLLHLAQSLRALGVKSEVFSFAKDNPLSAEFSAAEIPVHTTDATKLIYEDRVAALYKELAQFEPTAIFANLGAEAMEMLRYLPEGVIRIAMIHEQSMLEGPPKYKQFLDGIVVVNPSWVERCSAQTPGVPGKFLAHGIPLPEAQLVRNPNRADPLRLNYFGRLERTKGTHLFPQIIKELRGRGVPFRWTLYGNGPEEAPLREQLGTEIRTGEVIINPHVPRRELYRNIREHDIFILASDNEGGPLTLLESMAVGLVPVCNDIPCLIQEVVNHANGFVIPRNPEKYAEVISELHRDRPRLERMSAAARKTITDNYGLKAMAERYVDFVRSLSARSSPISWPAKIKPRPIQGLPLLSRISQGTVLGRQARRIAKRMGR